MKTVTTKQKNIALAIVTLFLLFIIFLIVLGLIHDPKGTLIGIFILGFIGALIWSAFTLDKYSEQEKNEEDNNIINDMKKYV